MEPKTNRIHQILAHLADAATTAADGMSDAMHSAGTAVGDKYSALKLNIELSRLQEEQRKLFCDIGRTMFLIQSGGAGADNGNEMVDAQQTVDRLLLLADQRQQEIDMVSQKLNSLNGDKVCTACGQVCHEVDTFCSSCGAKLPSFEKEPPAPAQPAAEETPTQEEKPEDWETPTE